MSFDSFICWIVYIIKIALGSFIRFINRKDMELCTGQQFDRITIDKIFVEKSGLISIHGWDENFDILDPI